MEKNKPTVFIIIIVLLVVLLASVVGISFYVISKINQETQTPPSEMTAPISPEVKIEDIKFVTIPPIATNLFIGANGNQHSIRISIEVGINSSMDTTVNSTSGDFYSLFTGKIGIVSDILLSTLRNTTYEQTLEAIFVDKFKEDILTKLRDKFRSNLIWEINIIELATV